VVYCAIRTLAPSFAAILKKPTRIHNKPKRGTTRLLGLPVIFRVINDFMERLGVPVAWFFMASTWIWRKPGTDSAQNGGNPAGKNEARKNVEFLIKIASTV